MTNSASSEKIHDNSSCFIHELVHMYTYIISIPLKGQKKTTVSCHTRDGASTIQMYSSTSTITLNMHEYEYKYEYSENKCTRVRVRLLYNVLEYEYDYFRM